MTTMWPVSLLHLNANVRNASPRTQARGHPAIRTPKGIVNQTDKCGT
jgi:hypothetical protein